MNSKRYIAIDVSLIFFLFINTSITFARSVYVISDTVDSVLQVYEIEDTNLTYQKDYTCQAAEYEDRGAVGLAIDYSEYGGAPILGFKKLAIKAHGRSNAKAIANAIRVAAESSRQNLCARIEESVGRFNLKHAVELSEL